MESMERGSWLETPEWTAEDSQAVRIVYFRKIISLKNVPEHFPVRVTACSHYKLYVNGQMVCTGPARGDDKVWYADDTDLSPYFSEGENAVAAAVLCPPENRAAGMHGMFRFGRPRFYAEGLGTGGWKCRVGREVTFSREEESFAPLQIHEHVVPKAEMTGWQMRGYDDSRWEDAVFCREDGLPSVLWKENLQPRPIPFAKRTMHHFTLPVRTVGANEETSFVLDAGEEMCAFLRLGLSGGRGARIELLESECYVLPDGSKGDRTDSLNGHLEGYTDFYTASGAEDEVYEPYWFRTFRFLMVTVRTAGEPLGLRFLDYEETGYPLETGSAVETSDQSLSSVWNISLRTLRRCMHETYMDCPFYEQLQYAMDSRSEILYTYAVSADDRLARQAIDDFRRALRPDGLINCSYPNVNVNVIPGFAMYYILMVHDHMMYFGDRELVRKNLPVIGRTLDFFGSRLTEEGLVGKVGGVNGKAPFWSFIDWAEEWMPTWGMPEAGLYGPVTMESLLYLTGLQHAAELCDFAGDGRAEEYRQRAAALLKAVRSFSMDESGMLTDGPGRPEISQHGQVFGILTGVLDEEEGRRNLLRTLTESGIPQCTVAMKFYLFRALEKTGLYSYTDRFWEIWRNMARNGCTTCVEAEYYPRSECHAWGALALYELPSVVLGVRPAAPGYEKIEVNPQPGYLTHASGTVRTPGGDIRVAWRLEDGKVRTEIDCPEALRARIIAK